MTTKTRSELITMALQELLVIGSGQSPEDEDVVNVDGRVDGLLAELALRGIIDVIDHEAIPVEYCGVLAELLANEVAPSFGKQKMPLQVREGIEERLRVMIQRRAAPNRYLETDTFLSGPGHLTYSGWASG